MDDIVPKTNDDAPVTDYVPLFGDWRDEVLFDSVAMSLVEYRKSARAEFEESIAALRLEVAELKGASGRAAHLAPRCQRRGDRLAPKSSRRCGLRRICTFSWVTGSPSASAAPN
jgi:hypothetical protein